MKEKQLIFSVTKVFVLKYIAVHKGCLQENDLINIILRDYLRIYIFRLGDSYASQRLGFQCFCQVTIHF